jgi:2-methylcitrate dehydratase PrpD
MGAPAQDKIGQLVNFVLRTRYEDLPEDVTNEVKRLLLDSIGCAVGGTVVQPGKIVVEMAERLGGPKDSSILGTSAKVSAVNAAFANGQLVNVLDYDALLPGGHTPPYVVPSVLAVSEAKALPGKALILATAIALEISARIGEALQQPSPIGDKPFRWPDRQGYAYCNVGVAAGAGKLLGLDAEKVGHALGIAGHLSQVLTWVRFSFTEPRPMTKYGVPGWQNTGGLIATFLAEMGYEGDLTLFDSEDEGFWKFCGYSQWSGEKVVKDLGRQWIFTRVNYKPYPCCRVLHPAIECLQSIMEHNDLQPEDIETVNCYLPKTVEAPVFTSRELGNIVDIQFGLPYVLAIAAYGIRPGPRWQDMELVRDPKILSFAEKVRLEVHPLTSTNPKLTTIEIKAKGMTFREEKTMPHGSADSPMSTEELIAKFYENVGGILGEDKRDKAVEQLLKLEDIEDVREVVSLVTFTTGR